VLGVTGPEVRARDPGLEVLLGAPAREHETDEPIVVGPQQLEALEALVLLDPAGTRGEAALELVEPVAGNGDGVDLDDAHGEQSYANPREPVLADTRAALGVTGQTVYLGRAFHGPNSIDGTMARNYAAAVDAITGTSTGWNPNLNGYMYAVGVAGQTVYLGGLFGTAGGQPRLDAAAVDAGSGAVSTWNPQLGDGGDGSSVSVDALALDGSTVYLGGYFTTADGRRARARRRHSTARP
jgi:hypothetical protein